MNISLNHPIMISLSALLIILLIILVILLIVKFANEEKRNKKTDCGIL